MIRSSALRIRAAAAPVLARSPGAGCAAAVLSALVVAACSTVPPPADDGAGAPSAPPSRRPGGYYKDDGPGDNPPADLDRIPDAIPRTEPLNRFANRPYSALGRAYIPATALVPYRERGTASWYGRRFHGQPTSSGDTYDMYAMTAAHPTLPIPSYARVTNLANGRSVVVRVNDRGPFHDGRIIDLSFAAAWRLGYVNAGSTAVEVRSILPDEYETVAAESRRQAVALAQADGPAPAAGADAPAPAPVAATEPVPGPQARPSGGVFLQLGAFASKSGADNLRGTAEEALTSLADRLEVARDGGRFRLLAGPYASLAEARAAAQEIAAVLKLRPFVVAP